MMQANIDALAYPPTHQYDLLTMKPRGPLAERVKAMARVAPGFFSGKRLLDIGANKGFFSLAYKDHFSEVSAIEPDLLYADLCKVLGVNVEYVSFRDYEVKKTFDRIFIGNVHHYLYRDSGWAWIAKLSVLASDLVLIDGPDGYIPDVSRAGIDKGFTREAFAAEMSRWFDLVAEGPTTSYNPDRKITLWRRHKALPAAPIPSNTAVLRPYTFDKNGNEKCGVLLADGVVWKIFNALDPTFCLRVQLAATSPYSNGLIGFVAFGDHLVGWCEPLVRDERPGEAACWQAYCRHQQFLASIGYTELDYSPANWSIDQGQIRTFDKNDVCSIAAKPLKNAMVMLRKNHDDQALCDRVEAALAERDSWKLEAAFKEKT